MQHDMKLAHEPFLAIQGGQKNVELRLHDEKCQRIMVGDRILFTDLSTGSTVCTQVTGKRLFQDFAALYAQYDKIRIGYRQEERPDPRDMEQYYAPEEIAAFGVVAIEIQLME